MLCWFCHWGWPKPIYEIYKRAESDIDHILRESGIDEPYSGEQALDYGPAHCVWSDENFDGDLSYYFNECDHSRFAHWPKEIMDIVRRSLTELLALPSEMKVCPSDYDGVNPENYPPQYEMVKE